MNVTSELPAGARRIDPPLAEAGADQAYQQLVYGRIDEAHASATLVARVVAEYPGRQVGRFYGVRLRGLLLDGTFRAWRSEPLGEVRWDDAKGWVQAVACPA